MKHISEQFKEGQWKGRRAFVIGGGPSLSGFPFEELKDELVIAVNKAHVCGVADVVVTGDLRWLTAYKPNERVDPSLPIIYAHRRIHPVKPGPGILSIHCCQEGGWGRSFEEGVTPGGSGIRAVNLTAILGANPIYLLGFDMGGALERKQEWWHGGYPRKDAMWYDSFLAYWKKVVQENDIPTDIYNVCNTSSKLDCFPKIEWKEVA